MRCQLRIRHLKPVADRATDRGTRYSAMFKRTYIITIFLVTSACSAAPSVQNSVYDLPKGNESTKGTEAMLVKLRPDLSAPAQSRYVTFSKKICDTLVTQGIAKSVDIGDFVPEYPSALIDPNKVESEVLTAGEIDDLVKGLSCGAGLSGFGPDVPETALALFASKAHGQKALSSLAKLRNEKTVVGMAAKDFFDQMGDYLKEPTE
jgi:hypothetical protein